jgi:hypothetical protein
MTAAEISGDPSNTREVWPGPAHPSVTRGPGQVTERPRRTSCSPSTRDRPRRHLRPVGASWTHEQFAVHYQAAQDAECVAGGPEFSRPIPGLATAIPPSATVSTAVHMLHALPKEVGSELPEQLLEVAHRNVADALHRCHRALELDGAKHGYHADEWLPTVYDIAGPLLESARLDREPPTVVQTAQDAISWLSRAISELDGGSEEAPSSLAETLARLLALWIFAEAALENRETG